LTLTKNTLRFNTMSERKSARRAPTPKRFSDEDVEKKPARKSTTSTTKPGGGGGSKVRVFLPFRKALWKPLLFFLCDEFENFLSFSLFSPIMRGDVWDVSSSSSRPFFSIANEARVSLSLSSLLFSSLPMEMLSLTFSRWWWW
jgi:hypothetical protein